jgi:hypothetical protein
VRNAARSHHLTNTGEITRGHADASAGSGRPCHIDRDISILSCPERLPETLTHNIGEPLTRYAFYYKAQNVRIWRRVLEWSIVVPCSLLQRRQKINEGIRGISEFGGLQQASAAIPREIALRILICLFEVQAHPHIEHIAQSRICIRG